MGNNFEDEGLLLMAKYICGLKIGRINPSFRKLSFSEVKKMAASYFEYKSEHSASIPTCEEYMRCAISKFGLNNYINIILGDEFIYDQFQSIEDTSETRDKIIMDINSLIIKFGKVTMLLEGNYYFGDEDDKHELIGAGGLCDVYHNEDLHKVCKQLKSEKLDDENMKSRFKSEFHIMKENYDKLSEHIIKVFDYDDEQHSFTMEKAECSLEEYLDENTLEADESTNIIESIFRGLCALAEHDINHRDFHAGNILLKDGKWLITDFGFSKQPGKPRSKKTNGTCYGRDGFIPPESIDGFEAYTMKSDVYSFGRVINYVMTKHDNNMDHGYGELVDSMTKHKQDDRPTMLEAFNKYIEIRDVEENIEVDYNDQIERDIFNSGTDKFLSEMSTVRLFSLVISHEGYRYALYHALEHGGLGGSDINGLSSSAIDSGDYNHGNTIGSMMRDIITSDDIEDAVKITAASCLEDLGAKKRSFYYAESHLRELRADSNYSQYF